MPSGTVKYIGPDGDWAFISRDDKQPKVFLHLSAVEKAGFAAIEKGQRWCFKLKEGRDGRMSAIDLEFLGSDR
ncbi:cold shock domain-containing protein (plasmid) [Sphingobium yanoikuyae]|uniref:Cold shock domain-containing protein n=1 Tax=Sphingobium yanoikuyae TaxID=13690 RepID=A0A6P1GQK0_SPHYA|nr:cold shock domain-containing protein [Sphingobium yanoikuyae]QHD70630.1 cold shock domain-containing protein [Sphingobium yanoikuyae]